MKNMDNSLALIKAVADYQFGRGVGERLFPDKVKIEYSPRTGRIRFVNLDGERLATLRPTDGMLSLSVKAAQFMGMNLPDTQCYVTIKNDVSEFVAKGGDAFAVHVLKADDPIRAKDEVIVLDGNKNVLAVGRSLLSSAEMTSFKTGVAVKVRHGSYQE